MQPIKKTMLALSVLVLLFGAAACGRQADQRSSQQTASRQDKTKIDDKDGKEVKTTDSTRLNPAMKTFLADFGQKYLNFDTVYQRNQSVRNRLTAHAQDELGIDADPHADFKSTGKVLDAYQSINDPQQYLLATDQHAQGQVFQPIIRLKIVKKGGQPKIDWLQTTWARTEDATNAKTVDPK